jgi:hypothetical protein
VARRLARVFGALLCCGLGSILASGCQVMVRGQPRPLVRQQKFRGELEAVAEYRNDKQESGDNKRESETKVFEERVRIRSTGDVYHPDFLNYDVMVGAGLAQQDTRSDDVSGWNSDDLSEYLASIEILRTKPYSATLNATKSQDLIARQFLGPLRADRQSESASVSLRPESWPMTFQYSRSETAQEGFDRQASDFFVREDQRFRYSLDHNFSKLSHVHFDFDHTEASQESVGAVVNTNTNAYTLEHDYTFGKDERHRLDSLLNYIDQGGSFEFQNLRLQERLKLQHTPSLFSKYDLQYSDLERETLGSQQIRGQAGIEHHLFDSLVTNLDGFISETDLGQDGKLQQYGGILGLSYHKTNPWGTLFSGYNVSFTRSDQTGGEGKGVVVGEAHAASDIVPIELNRTNIDVATLRVRTAAGILYQQGDDYTVSQRDGRVFLTTHVVGGVVPPSFTEGQEFFVDYEYFVEPERQEDTLRQNFTLRERFKNGLSVYYGLRTQQETVTSTVASVVPDEYLAHTVGADYTYKGLFLVAEYTTEDSTLIPMTGKKLEGRYRWQVAAATTASIGLSNQWLDFDKPDERQVQLFEATAELFSRLADHYSISGSVGYRDEDDSRFGATRGFRIDSKLEYQYRQFTATIGADLDFLERRDDQIDGVYLYIRAMRRF